MVYGGTHAVLTELLPEMGITATLVPQGFNSDDGLKEIAVSRLVRVAAKSPS